MFSKSLLHAAVLALAVPATVALFVLSADYSGQEHASLQSALGDLSLRSTRVSDTVMRLGLALQSDYDDLTLAERDLRCWTQDYPEARRLLAALPWRARQGNAADELRRMIEEKLVLSGDFKAGHSIVRNASAGFARNVRSAAEGLPPNGPLSATLLRLERCELRYYQSHSVADRRQFQSAIHHAQAAAANDLRDSRSLDLTIACAETLIELHDDLKATLERLVANRIEEVTIAITDASRRRLREKAGVTRAYRGALMVAIASLIAYCVYLCVAVARHSRALRHANEHLEERVAERTRELTEKTEELEETLRNRDELRDALSEARRLEAIGELAAGVAHEINTPLQFVSTNIEFIDTCSENLFEVVDAYGNALRGVGALSRHERIQLLDEVLSEKRYKRIQDQTPEAIADAKEGIRRVVEIVRAMRNLSHPGGDEKAPTDLNEALRSAATITRNRWKHAAELTLDLDPALPQVEVFLSELNQVLINLIVNAADALVEKNGENGPLGSITVRSEVRDDAVVIAVQDDGCGMPEEVRRRIFEPFFTTKEVGKGTGQGLAITHRVIVGRHNGTIEVITAPGEGTCFEVTLPIHEEQPTQTPDEEEADLALAAR